MVGKGVRASLIVAVTLLILGWGRVVHVDAQGTPSFRVDPGTQNVASGSTFEVNIVQTTAFSPTAAQTDLQFDPSLVQVVNAEAGAPYASATFLVGVAPQTTAEAIAEANTTGVLKNMAVFILPGTGTAGSAGDNVAFKVTMRAKDFSGASPLRFAGFIQMLDENGGCYGCPATGDVPPLGPISVSEGSVNITGGGAPPPPGAAPAATPSVVGGTPTVSAATPAPRTPLATGSQVSTVLSESGRDEVTGTSLLLEPRSLEVAKGEQFSLQLKSSSDVALSSVTVQIRFDSEAVALESIEPGSAWTDATGADEATLETVVSQANETSSIEASLLLGSGESTSAGEDTVMTLNMRGADTDATSPLQFVSVQMTDADGNAVTAKFEDGQVIVGSGGAASSSLATWALIFLLLVAVGGTGYGAYFMVQRRRRQWAT